MRKINEEGGETDEATIHKAKVDEAELFALSARPAQAFFVGLLAGNGKARSG